MTLSLQLFNLVNDEFLKDHCKDDVAFESGELKMSAIAFTEDLLLFASTPMGSQYKLNALNSFLELRGLSPNPAKCVTLSMAPAGKEKLVKIDAGICFTIGAEPIPAAEGETCWRYLGVSFESCEAQQIPIHAELRRYLERTTKAPLKPQQRPVILRYYLLPRLYHKLVLGPVSQKLLIRLVKQSVLPSATGSNCLTMSRWEPFTPKQLMGGSVF